MIKKILFYFILLLLFGCELLNLTEPEEENKNLSVDVEITKTEMAYGYIYIYYDVENTCNHDIDYFEIKFDVLI